MVYNSVDIPMPLFRNPGVVRIKDVRYDTAKDPEQVVLNHCDTLNFRQFIYLFLCNGAPCNVKTF